MFRSRLETFLIDEFRVCIGSLNYAAIGLDCWGTSYDALSSSLFLSLSVDINVSLMQVTDLTSSRESL